MKRYRYVVVCSSGYSHDMAREAAFFPFQSILGGGEQTHDLAALLQKGVAVSIVDIVTVRQFNLYVELMGLIGHSDPTMGDPPPHTYAAACRWVKRGERTRLQTWSHRLEPGAVLPTLPLWLDAELVVPLNLEESYERTCDDLWLS